MKPSTHAVCATLLAVLSATAFPWDLCEAQTFTNVTEEAGVSYVQGDQPSMTGGAAVGDFDGDGWEDLYVTRLHGSDILFRNLGDGTFEDVTAEAGLLNDVPTNGAGWADVDNDGDLDLYVTGNGTFRHYLYINDGNGHFTEESVPRGASTQSDIIHRGFSVSFGDYDRDGWIDIHTTENLGLAPDPPDQFHRRLLRNLGPDSPGYFEDVTEAAEVLPRTADLSFSTAFADLDQDGWPDLAIASDFGTSELLWNNGDGTFTEGFLEAGLRHTDSDMGSTLGDYDNDGDLDWFITAIRNNRLYRNDGDRTFTDVTQILGVKNGDFGWGTALFDFDNDGDLDIAMTNGSVAADPNYLWRNDGPNQAMADISVAAGIDDTRFGKGLLVFDYDRDGDLDLFIVNSGSTPLLYRNDGGNTNHWLRIRFRGHYKNTEGLGVKIWLRQLPDGPLHYREMGVSTHFLGQSERVAHFGLGPDNPGPLQLTMRTTDGFEYIVNDLDFDKELVFDADDFDGDGISNRLERIFGSDPYDPENPDRLPLTFLTLMFIIVGIAILGTPLVQKYRQPG